MYPATIVTWEDRSDIITPEITNVRTMPLFASVITADKGVEEWVRISGQDWFDMYAVNNKVDFERHGQALLQTAVAVEAGAEILCKRVVAEDATLANLAVIATTTKKAVQSAVNANFFADAQASNDYLGVSDSVDGTMFIKLAQPTGIDRYLISVKYPTGQVYDIMYGDGTNMTATKLYWDVTTDRQYDFGKTGTYPGLIDGLYTITLYSYQDDTLAAGSYPTTKPTKLTELFSTTITITDGDSSNQTEEIAQPEGGKTVTTVSYSFKSATGCKTQKEVIEAISSAVESDKAAAGEDSGVYLLWLFFDNGRGESKKRIRISPNYQLSKTQTTYFMYDINVIESGKVFDSVHFCIDPTIVSDENNISLKYQVNRLSKQIEAYQFDEDLLAFMDTMIAATGLDAVDAIGMDLLFGTNKKGKNLSGIIVDTDAGVDLTITTGQILQNGSNGAFGDAPIKSELYGPMVAKAFAGYVIDPVSGEPTIQTYSDELYDTRIYDVDRYKIDAVLDANYPHIVKRAIEQLAAFREDFMYFRDMGTKCNTLDLIVAEDFDNMKSKFCSTYCTYYDVIDPYSKKQITVTITYSLAKQLVQQFNNGRNLPIAGIKYGFVITDIVKNTLGFAPAVCPNVNQKDELYDMRVNYATYIDDELVIESLYTSQERYSQLSFANNVLAVQQVIKKIRSKCPAIRYSFIDGSDLEKYKAEVEEIIAPYKSNFKELTLEYMQDPYYTENKIFYATLAVRFRDFAQTEYFKIVALGSNDTATTSAVRA